MKTNSQDELLNAYHSMYLRESKEIEGVEETEKDIKLADGQEGIEKIEEDQEINLKITASTEDKTEEVEAEEKKEDDIDTTVDASQAEEVAEESVSAFDMLLKKFNISELNEDSEVEEEVVEGKRKCKKKGKMYKEEYDEEGVGMDIGEYSRDEKIEMIIELASSLMGGGDEDFDDTEDFDDIPDEDIDFEESVEVDEDEEAISEMTDHGKSLGHALLNLKKGLALRKGNKVYGSKVGSAAGKAKKTTYGKGRDGKAVKLAKDFKRSGMVKGTKGSGDPLF